MLRFTEKPEIKMSSVVGQRYKSWREGDFKITYFRGGLFISWQRFNLYDKIDDRHITGWQPIDKNRTFRAAIRRCREVYRLQQSLPRRRGVA